MKYSSKTPMLKDKKYDIKKVITSLLNERKNVGKYEQSLVNLNAKQIYKILKNCVKGDAKGDFVLNFNKKDGTKKFPFVLFLTSTQDIRYKTFYKERPYINKVKIVMIE